MARDLFAEQQPRDLFQEPKLGYQQLGELDPGKIISGIGSRIAQPFQAISEMVTGNERATPQTESLPELQSSGLLSGESKLKTAAVTPALVTAIDPNEIAQIITSNFPNVQMQQQKDAQGNVYPILVNNQTGARAIVNKPGMSGLDVMQLLGLGAAFTPAGRGSSGLGALALKGAGTQAAIEGVQAASGGEFNPLDVAIAGAALPGAQVMADKVLAPVIKGASQKVIDAFTKQSPAKQKIADLINQGIPENEIAKWKLKGSGDKAKVVEDVLAKETLRQGFDDGVIAATKLSSASDKKQMLEMLKTSESALKSGRFAAENRPTDVIGKSITDRFKTILDANKQAGKDIDRIAVQELKGRPVEFDPSVQQFLDDLSVMGVQLREGFQPVFKGSDLQGLAPSERLIGRVLARLKDAKNTDAYSVHRLKRFLDEQVTYGKSSEGGLSNEASNAVKKLRAGLDDALDETFPNYNQANSAYAETIGILDDFKSIAGKSFDITSPNAAKQAGTLSRRVLGNAQSRASILDSLSDLQTVANKYGGAFDDDIITQVMFADELERVLGTQAKTSLQGEVEKAVQTAARGGEGIKETAFRKVGEGLEKARGINKERAIEAIRRLLERQE